MVELNFVYVRIFFICMISYSKFATLLIFITTAFFFHFSDMHCTCTHLRVFHFVLELSEALAASNNVDPSTLPCLKLLNQDCRTWSTFLSCGAARCNWTTMPVATISLFMLTLGSFSFVLILHIILKSLFSFLFCKLNCKLASSVMLLCSPW